MSDDAAETIDDYIATFAKDVQQQLQQVRRAIAKATPGAAESISYRIPAFKRNGRPLTYFAGYKTHISLYPVQADSARFSQAMARYAAGKATLKFPLDEPRPLNLIATVAKAKVRVASVAKKKTPRAAAGSR